MEKIIINGGNKLDGVVEISGMKNAAVAVIFANILVGGKCVLENLPDIVDVSVSLEILQSIACGCCCSQVCIFLRGCVI